MNKPVTTSPPAARTTPSKCPFSPLVPGLPLLGNSLSFLRDTSGFLLGSYRTHGPIFRIRMLWLRFTVILGFEAREFMQDGGERHLTRHPVFDPVGRQLGSSDFALALSGEKHLRLRKMLQVAYSREVAGPFVPEFVAAVRLIAREWADGGSREVFESVQELAFEQYCHVMCGQSLRPHYRDCRVVTDMNMSVGGRVLPLWMFHWPPYRATRKRVLGIVGDLIAKHRGDNGPGASGEKADIMDTLMAQRFPDGRPMNDDEVGCYAMYGFAGSCSYMGRLVSFMLYEIFRDADLKRRLVEEIDRVFEDGLNDAGDVAEMRLLRAVYHETLRFHPVSQGMPYVAAEDFEFRGSQVSKGELVVLSQLPTLFADPPFTSPDRFDPARCMEPRNEHRKAGAFNPFGMHHRTCAAMGLVELMAMTLVATLLREREMATDPGDYQLRFTVKPLPAPDSNFKMRTTARVAPSRTFAAARPLQEEVFLASFPGADDPEVLEALAESISERFPPGTVILQQGAPAKTFHIIAEGRVEVLRETPDGVPERKAVLGPGDCFGEIGLLNDTPRTATVRVLPDAPARVITLSAAAFKRIVASSDMVSAEIARVVRRRTSGELLHEAAKTMPFETVKQRLPEFVSETCPPGSRILREGEPPDRFYLLWTGEAQVLRTFPDGVERPVALLKPGTYFGETGLLLNRPRNATVNISTLEPAVVLSCGREEFENLVREAGGRDGDLALSLANRLRG